MKSHKQPGVCELCGVELPASEMTRHLGECIEDYRYDVGREEERGPQGYHVAFQSVRAPLFWIQVLADASGRLAHLDAFLRDVWMESPNRYSRFEIGTDVYSSEPTAGEGPSSLEGDLSVNLREVLETDAPFRYAYDREATTEIEGRVVAKRTVLPDDDDSPVRLLARNRPPTIPCACGAEAEFVCPACADGPEGWMCEDCADDHPCRGTPAPIRNTPRATVSV